MEMIPTWNDKPVLMSALGFSGLSVDTQDAVDDFAEVAVDLAEKTFVVGQVVAAMTGKLERFACTVEDYIAGRLEVGYKPWDAVPVSLALIMCHHYASDEKEPCYVFDLSVAAERAVLGKADGDFDGAITRRPSGYRFDADPLLRKFSIAAFEMPVFQAEDGPMLSRLYSSSLPRKYRFMEEQICFFPRFCPQALEFASLCLVYWHALYQVLYGAPGNPFGELTDGIRREFKGYSSEQLIAACVVAMRGMVTFKDGTRDFYDSFDAFNNDHIYKQDDTSDGRD